MPINETFDYVIIGSGFRRVGLRHEDSREKGYSVLVLERGKRFE